MLPLKIKLNCITKVLSVKYYLLFRENPISIQGHRAEIFSGTSS